MNDRNTNPYGVRHGITWCQHRIAESRRFAIIPHNLNNRRFLFFF